MSKNRKFFKVLISLLFIICISSQNVLGQTSWIFRDDVGIPNDAPWGQQDKGVYDSNRKVIVRYAWHETWEYNGELWYRVDTKDRPNAIRDFSMAFDSRRGVVVLFGGSTSLGETWEYDGSNWEQKITSHSPQPRIGHKTVYDKLRGVIVLFGGGGYSWNNLFRDTWEYDGENWRYVETLVSPIGRLLFDMVYDEVNRRTILYGGYIPYRSLNDTWEFDGENWINIATGPNRHRVKLTNNPYSGKTYLFGGVAVSSTGFNHYNDMWVFDDNIWQKIETLNTPPPLTTFISCFDKARSLMVIQGGIANIDGLNYRNHKTWELVFPIRVIIDIKPDGSPNSINLKSNGVIPVAVLTNTEFDAENINPNTVIFAGAIPTQWALEDVDDDGDIDMIFHFKTKDLNLNTDSIEACLSGKTIDGKKFEGCDSVNIIK